MKIGLIHQGWPAGSFITTRGLQRAFTKRPEIDAVYRVSAAQINELPNDLDFVFVEGFPGRRRWIQIQRIPTRKYYWWLSTNFGRMTAQRVGETSFDHVFSNSQHCVEALAVHKPATFLPLAFDPTMSQGATPEEKYRSEVAYLGIAGHKSKDQLRTIIEPASRFDFQLWGKGWQFTRYRKFHKGILPPDDIAKLYASTQVVLGMTEGRQKELGMINNRVFEALGCGASFVGDHFPELQSFFEDRVMTTSSQEETEAAVQRVLDNPHEFERRRKDDREWILQKHTYDHRVSTILQVHTGRS